MFIAESPKVIQTALDAGYEPISCLVEKKHVEGQAALILAQCGDIPVYTAEFDVLTQLTGFRVDERYALCHAKKRFAVSGRCLQKCPKNCDSGGCYESDECGSDFPLSSGSWNGWHSSDISFKQSISIVGPSV